MDGTTVERPQTDVQAQLAEIKAHMPQTYRAIQEKAASGARAFRYVRSGLRGEPNQFYAIEGGRVVGTPFNLANVHEELTRFIAQWGCTFLIMWSPEAQKDVTDGKA